MKTKEFYACKEQDFPQLFIVEYQEIKANIENDITEIEEDIRMANLLEDYKTCINLNSMLSTLKCVKQQYKILIEKNLN